MRIAVVVYWNRESLKLAGMQPGLWFMSFFSQYPEAVKYSPDQFGWRLRPAVSFVGGVVIGTDNIQSKVIVVNSALHVS